MSSGGSAQSGYQLNFLQDSQDPVNARLPERQATLKVFRPDLAMDYRDLGRDTKQVGVVEKQLRPRFATRHSTIHNDMLFENRVMHYAYRFL